MVCELKQALRRNLDDAEPPALQSFPLSKRIPFPSQSDCPTASKVLPATVDDVLATLKEGREDFLESVAEYE